MNAIALVALLPALAMGASVSGKISDTSNTGLAGLEVRLWGSTPKGYVFQGPYGFTTTTDGSGNYSFASVPAGSYKLDARMPNGYAGNWGDRWYDVAMPSSAGYTPDDADVLVLTASTALSNLNIALELNGGFDGRVINGSPLPNFYARAELVSDRRVHHNDVTKNDGIRPGEYSFRGLRPGATRLVLHDPNYVLGDTIRTGLTVTTGGTPNIGDTSMSTAPVDAREPNNSSSATGANFDGTIFRTTPPTAFTASGAIGPRNSGDSDWYCFDAVVGDRYLVNVAPTLTLEDMSVVDGPWFDPVVGFFSPGAVKLGEDDDTGPGNAARFDTGELTLAGKYCVAVTAFGDTTYVGQNQNSAGTYGLSIAMGNRRPNVAVSVNSMPAPNPPAKLTIEEGESITLVSSFIDPDGNLVSGTFDLRNASNVSVSAGSVNVSSGTNSFTWTAPNTGARGSPYTFTITVTDGEFSRTATVLIEVTAVNIAPNLPTLVSPDAGSTVSTRSPTLVCAESYDLDEETLSYEFELTWADGGLSATVVGVDGGWLADAGTAAPLVLFNSTPIPENSLVSWRVRAYDGNASNGYSVWTTPWTFFVDSINDPPFAPVLTKPLDQEIVTSRRPTLQSTNPIDLENEAVTLSFQVASDIAFATVVHTSAAVPTTVGSSTTSYTLPVDLMWGGSYFARVTATDARGGVSPRSNVNAFSVRANSAPGAPTIGDPFASCGTSLTIMSAPAGFVVPYVPDFELDTLTIDARLFNALDDPNTATPLFTAMATQVGTNDTNIPFANVTFVEDATYRLRVRVSDGLNTTSWTECIFTFSALPNIPDAGTGGGSATGGGTGTGGGNSTGGGNGTGGGSGTGGGIGTGGSGTGGSGTGGSTGMETGGGTGTGGGGGTGAKPGCGCTTLDPLAPFAVLLGLAALRRRRR